MPLRPILRLLLAGLLALLLEGLAGAALLTPGPLTLDPPSAHADGPGDWPFLWKGWPMFRHDPVHTGYNPGQSPLKARSTPFSAPPGMLQ